MSYWVYILFSESIDSYYKGQTDDLSDRISRHNHGMEKATKNGKTWKLIWKAEKPDRASAMLLEKKLKNLSRKRLIEFMLKYSDIVASPDVP